MRFSRDAVSNADPPDQRNGGEINTGSFENYGGDTRVLLIFVCGRRRFPRRPAVVWSCCRAGGLLVWWSGRAVSGYIVASCSIVWAAWAREF